MARHAPSEAPLPPWIPGNDDEAAFGSPPPSPTTSMPGWRERLRYAAADVLAAGALSNRLVEASAAAEAPVTTGRRIVVLGAGDGVGTSTVAALLARLFGSLRREPVLGVDLSGGPAGLLRYLGAEYAPPLPPAAEALAARPARNLAGLLDPGSAAGNHVFALGCPALFAAGGRPGGQPQEQPEGQSWSALSSLFSRFAAVTIVDAGSSPASRLTGAALQTAHAAVVVAPDDDGGEQGAAAARQELSVTFPGLPLLTVWTGSDQLVLPGGELSLPWDSHLSGGGGIRLRALGAGTRIAATEIAGAVITAANQK